MDGIVLKSTGSWLQVAGSEHAMYSCRVRGQLRLRGIDSTNPIAVGDHVFFEIQDDGNGIITDIAPRKNYIIRKSVKLSKQTQILAANIDMAWLVVTPELPKTSTGFIDRFIAAAESFRIPTGLIFNKSDLFKEDLEAVQHEYIDLYAPLGYPCFKTSSITHEGISDLHEAFSGKVNLLAGHSGVGKSSLINVLEPELKLKTGDISRQHLKGKHTTTFAEMHPLRMGGFLIDTPGIREFVNIDFKPAEIGHYFVEIRARMHACKFNNCLHENEKDCAIKAAVEKGEINRVRYYNYLSILRNEDIFR
ncbi:MAG: ribosome small subunit-dependent GTPase A [Bacteroidia bacterium]|nr:ribosome small subunit-dependent GTPase A [Bacteroidia bacterium]